MPRVTITVPEKAPQPYRFDLHRKVVTIGRGNDNDIVVGCGSVSGKHSEMHRVEGGYQLIDVGSTNGIKIDGIRHKTVVLHTGMTVKLGDVEFGFTLSDEELAVLASEAEPVPAPVESEDKEEEIPKKPSSRKVVEEKDEDEEDEDEDEDDGPDKLPEAPVRLNKREEKEEREAEKAKKAEKEKRAKQAERAEKEKRSEKREKREKPESSDQSLRKDEYSESRAVSIGFGFILFTLIAVAAAFFYGANTRHEKDTGENLLKGIVNKEDVKNSDPTEVEDKADGGSE